MRSVSYKVSKGRVRLVSTGEKHTKHRAQAEGETRRRTQRGGKTYLFLDGQHSEPQYREKEERSEEKRGRKKEKGQRSTQRAM